MSAEEEHSESPRFSMRAVFAGVTVWCILMAGLATAGFAASFVFLVGAGAMVFFVAQMVFFCVAYSMFAAARKRRR